jgi:hypothetical protein
MNKYQITLNGTKTVSDYDRENGDQDNPRIADTWETTTTSNSIPRGPSGRRLLNDFIFDRYGLGANDLKYWNEEPNRFSASRIEDEDGNENPNGPFIADYDIYITIVRTSPEIQLSDHFGLESIDG